MANPMSVRPIVAAARLTVIPIALLALAATAPGQAATQPAAALIRPPGGLLFVGNA